MAKAAIDLASELLDDDVGGLEELRIHEFADDEEAHDDDAIDKLHEEFASEYDRVVTALSQKYGNPSRTGKQDDEVIPVTGVFRFAVWSVGAKQLFAAAAHEDRGAPILLMLGTGYDLSSPPAGPASKTGGVGGEAIKDAAGNAEQIAAVRQRFERLKAIKKRPVHPWYHLSPIDLYRALVVVPIIGVLASIFLDWHKWYLVCAGLFLIGVGFWLFVRIAFVSDDIRGARSNRSGRAFLLGLGILIAFSVAGVLIMPWREP